jgi:GT2 family glycosyltransferase
MDPSVSIVILNWNGRKFLEKFLPSVVEHARGHAEVVVADNASSDDSMEFVRTEYPQIRTIYNRKNYGFAGGYNEALKQVEADYYILLNSDIEVTPGWIEPLVDMMESDKSIAACQPKLLSYHEPTKFEYAGAAGGFIDKYGYPFCRGRIFQTIETDHGQYDDDAELFWATGACLMIRTGLFHAFGGFDARFFAHMEEIDLCWRLKNAGYSIRHCYRSVVYHIGAGTLPKKSWKKTYLNMRNNNIMIFKNLPHDRLLKVFIARFFLDGLAAFKFLVDGGFKDFFAVTRAHFSLYRRLPGLKRERRKSARKHVSLIYQKNLVFEYFLRRKTKFTDLDKDHFSR